MSIADSGDIDVTRVTEWHSGKLKIAISGSGDVIVAGELYEMILRSHGARQKGAAEPLSF